MRRVVISVCALLLGCGGGPLTDAGASDEAADGDGDGEATGSDDGLATTGGPDEGCSPSTCDYECGQTYDDCVQPREGVCEDGVCVCESPGSCLPCGSAGECLEWETCDDEYSLHGECDLLCYYAFEYSWDPEVGCVIALDPDLPLGVFQAWFTELDDASLPEGDDCGEPDAFVLDTAAYTLKLCPDACAQFEAGNTLRAGWAVFCE